MAITLGGGQKKKVWWWLQNKISTIIQNKMTKSSKCCKAKSICFCKTSGSYIISSPGNYNLCKSVVFNPLSNGQSAIKIQSSDVNLNFCGFKLSQNPTSITLDSIGVEVVVGVQNIHIYGGTIQGFQKSSIQVAESVNNVTVDNMCLQGSPTGARITGPETSGISISGLRDALSTKISIHHVQIYDFVLNNREIPDQSIRAVNLSNTKDVDLRDINVYNLNSTALVTPEAFPPLTGVYGFSLRNSQNVNMLRCYVADSSCIPPDQLDSTNTLVVVGDIYGLLVEGAPYLGIPFKNLTALDCTCANLTGTRRAEGNIFAQEVSNVFMERCIAKNVVLLDETSTLTESSSGFELIGVVGLGSPDRLTFKNCEVKEMRYGFSVFASKNVIIQGCNIQGRELSNSDITWGIHVRQSANGTSGSNVTIEDCIISGFIGPVSTYSFNGSGIYVRGGDVVPYSVNIRRNKITKCTTGIYVRNVQNGDAVLDGNEAAYNLNDGILIDATSKNHLIQNCLAIGNGNIGFNDLTPLQNGWVGNRAQRNTTADYQGIALLNIVSYDYSSGMYSAASVFPTTNLSLVP